jgi:hypothetical protein
MESVQPLQDAVYADPAVRKYLTTVTNRKRNNGYISYSTSLKAISATRRFLQFLVREVTQHALSDRLWRVFGR